MLVHRAPQVVGLAVDLDEDLVKVPLVTRACPSAAQSVGVGLAERSAPLPDGLVGDRDAALQHHLLDVAEAQREPVIEPHAVADDLRWEAEPSVRRRLGAHQPSPLNVYPTDPPIIPATAASQVDGAFRRAWIFCRGLSSSLAG